MTVGFVMLAHTALDRAAQVARHWARNGSPVVIHLDRKVSDQAAARFRLGLQDEDRIVFCERRHCEWGSWSLVEAAQAASELMLERFPDIGHVMLVSGSCLPIRPAQDLCDFLENRPGTDFIESATTQDVPWTVDGLNMERFTLRFPFSWRRQRGLFDRWVSVQRRLGLRRRLPGGLVPHLGSQWWCLSRRTLSGILNDPRRKEYDQFFRKAWIPDESYFQSLARKHSRRIESRSLTLSKFDFQGRPHIFYDDHLSVLEASDCFVARKIWPRAHGLYSAFLTRPNFARGVDEFRPLQVTRKFTAARHRRTLGRTGLYMQSRFPHTHWENGITARDYSIFSGFADLFPGFHEWLERSAGVRAHGRLYAPDGAQFSGGAQMVDGALSASPTLRDHDPRAFLTNLVWSARNTRQTFDFTPADSQAIAPIVAADPGAQISVITGAWAIPLFLGGGGPSDIRHLAADLQRKEAAFVNTLREPWAKARIRIWSLADFVEAPIEHLQEVVDEMAAPHARRLREVPQMRDLDGFGSFLQGLRDTGMHPYLTGDFANTYQQTQFSELACRTVVDKF
ncbi:Core-2/I-Branching enzyme [Poseidonocella pacifica]|uniref:Peptide O-xylosyltransferase n=1 Tax=Poseidonocella pacifica TaxID=871651 RepID=A0A1I0YFB2_9RHOB|nr:beta-1,6-N-acetylglucosaminyltransferase [Poseidonocella pacifica]SFB11872.1 Core-2/I-Branching enzyme [Poseidonocella pacifica]